MNIIFKNLKWLCKSKMIFAPLSLLFILACDFQGPWEYYPEDREIYKGIYTFGTIIAGESPRVCFSKLYDLNETAAEQLAFYDSAYVTVTGEFESGKSTVELSPLKEDPNCFENLDALGVKGNSYKMDAVIRWDSLGTMVESKFNATANIPPKFSLNALVIPQKNGSVLKVENDHQLIETDALEYPLDMTLYKFAPEINSQIGGVAVTMEYDTANGGETVNNTLNNMIGGMLDKDSLGYGGISTKDPTKNFARAGFYENMKVGSINNADTIFIPSMSLPVGNVKLKFYATDYAYVDYIDKVIESFDDPRVLPESNIQNGMGTFSGMVKDSVMLKVNLENFVSYKHMQISDCIIYKGDGDAWDSKFCRLKHEEFCYEDFELAKTRDWCGGALVKYALSHNENSEKYLEPTLSSESKKSYLKEGLKRYCIENNYNNNEVADCSEIYKSCNEDSEKNECKEFLWNFCADRDWNLEKYSQSKSALISRFYLENVQSNLIKKQVEILCKEDSKNIFCL